MIIQFVDLARRTKKKREREKQFGKKHFAIVLNKIYSLNSVDFQHSLLFTRTTLYIFTDFFVLLLLRYCYIFHLAYLLAISIFTLCQRKTWNNKAISVHHSFTIHNTKSVFSFVLCEFQLARRYDFHLYPQLLKKLPLSLSAAWNSLYAVRDRATQVNRTPRARKLRTYFPSDFLRKH